MRCCSPVATRTRQPAWCARATPPSRRPSAREPRSIRWAGPCAGSCAAAGSSTSRMSLRNARHTPATPACWPICRLMCARSWCSRRSTGCPPSASPVRPVSPWPTSIGSTTRRAHGWVWPRWRRVPTRAASGCALMSARSSTRRRRWWSSWSPSSSPRPSARAGRRWWPPTRSESANSTRRRRRAATPTWSTPPPMSFVSRARARARATWPRSMRLRATRRKATWWRVTR